MKKQRCRPSPARLLLWSAALLLVQASLPSRAGAVQLFVDQTFVHATNASCTFQPGPPIKFSCPGTSANPVTSGNISNEPHIEFEQQGSLAAATGADGCTFGPALQGILPGVNKTNFCNSDVFLCTSIGYANNEAGSTAIALSEVNFELFKFLEGSNPLDPGSTPPLRTFFLDSPGFLKPACNSSTAGCEITGQPFCVLWDGLANLKGEQAKTNGTYGFRVTVKTNTTGASGNITITATRAYPSGATLDADVGTCVPTVPNPAGGCVTSQKPISVDVTNIHVVRSSPTIVGAVTGVAAQPYNITYRLSKDASMYITIQNSASLNLVRTILPGMPRFGEGTPDGTAFNGDAWNGRADNGDFVPAGLYLATLQAEAKDQYGKDLSVAATRQIGIDPMQITDLRVLPLLAGSTSLAVLTYELTEPATAYVDVYPPGTQFCSGLLGVTNKPDINDPTGVQPPKDFRASLDGCVTQNVMPLRRFTEVKNSRAPVITFWDGRDRFGRILDDADYVFVLYAAMASQNGTAWNANPLDKRIWTLEAKSGFLPIIRGFVGISQVIPGSSLIGSSPAVSGLNPFIFRYNLSREALVSLRILDSTGLNVIKTLMINQTRPGGTFGNTERWDEPTDDSGRWVSSGTYLVQLTAADPLLPAKVSTTTSQFPLDLFRIVDVQTSPLISGNSEFLSISYQLSQAMQVSWNIYPPGTQILNSSGTWPPCNSLTPGSNCPQLLNPTNQMVGSIYNFQGLKAGRMRNTEFWDGRDANGLIVPDGSYVFTLTAKSTTTPTFFPSDRIFGSITVSRGQIFFTNFQVTPDVPQLFNSSSTITLHPFTVAYSLSRQSSVTIQILNTAIPPAVIRTLFAGNVKSGGILTQDVWDGRDDRGNFPPSGFYNVRAVAQDVAAVLSAGSTSQLTISYDPLRIYDVAVTPLRSDSGGAQVFYQVSETMKVAVKIYRPGTVFDISGNPSPPEAVSLVKRIVGVRPARTEIAENWNGSDLRQSITTEGNYKFKIIGSTDINAIDTLTGNVLNASALSLDKPIDDIPVIRSGSAEPGLDFENNTFAYPNPGTGPTMTFAIWVPFQARVKMKVFTISGEMILDKDFGEWPSETYVNGQGGFVWNKTNQAGRKVARGMYFCVIRVEDSLGGKNILQSVKRILIP